MIKLLFPLLIIVESFIASLIFFIGSNWIEGIYWISVGFVNLSAILLIFK